MRASPALGALLVVLSSSLSGLAAPKEKPAQDKPAKDHKSASGKGVTLKVEVVDLTNDRAYITPGAKAGLRVGDPVKIGRDTFEVIAVTASSAVLKLDKSQLEVGDKGTAAIELDREAVVVERIKPPPPAATFRDSWSPARPPAEDQNPAPVPLGLVQAQGHNRASVSMYGYGLAPAGNAGTGIGFAELRGQLHYEPFTSAPFALDVDLSGQTWISPNLSARRAGDARPALRVRRLEAAYGRERSWFASGGRLRYASSFLGSLDGVKVRAPLFGDVSVSAFGGAVPEPLSGVPSSTARFGGEFALDAVENELRPRVILGGSASRFNGTIDERRLNASVDLLPRFGRFGASAEVSFFDADNPWRANTTELTSAMADASVRMGIVELSGRGGLQRPERSQWLASFLPPEWLCVAGATAASPGTCLGSDATYSGSGEVGIRLTKLSATIGGHAATTQNTNANAVGGFTHLRLLDIVSTLRVDAGASAARTSFLTNAGFSFSPGVELLDRTLDLSLRYRPAITRYTADDSAFVEHLIGGAIWFSPSRHLDLALDGDRILGADVDVFVVQGLVTWRPEI